MHVAHGFDKASCTLWAPKWEAPWRGSITTMVLIDEREVTGDGKRIWVLERYFEYTLIL